MFENEISVTDDKSKNLERAKYIKSALEIM